MDGCLIVRYKATNAFFKGLFHQLVVLIFKIDYNLANKGHELEGVIG